MNKTKEVSQSDHPKLVMLDCTESLVYLRIPFLNAIVSNKARFSFGIHHKLSTLHVMYFPNIERLILGYHFCATVQTMAWQRKLHVSCVNGCTVEYQSSFCDQNKFLHQEAYTHPEKNELGLNEYYYKRHILDNFMKNKIIYYSKMRDWVM